MMANFTVSATAISVLYAWRTTSLAGAFALMEISKSIAARSIASKARCWG
jgi:hypothetical protein